MPPPSAVASMSTTTLPAWTRCKPNHNGRLAQHPPACGTYHPPSNGHSAYYHMQPSCAIIEIRDILSHGRIVLTLAQRHGGLGWLEYDRAFRQQATADLSIRWNTLNPSLMAATVLSAPPSLSFQPCPHCHEADHRGPDCALASVDPYTEFKPITPRPKPYTRPPPADAASIEICRRFNRGICTDPSRCKYRHICAIPTCLKPGHSALACPLRQDLSRPRPGPPPTR